jgi:hypothetical protein
VSKVLSFKVLFQWSYGVVVARYKVQVVWWMGKIFLSELLQELCCGMVCMSMKIIMEENLFLFQEVR